jgi:hypothetical protein
MTFEERIRESCEQVTASGSEAEVVALVRQLPLFYCSRVLRYKTSRLRIGLF